MTEEDEIIALQEDKKTLAKMFNHAINYFANDFESKCPPGRSDNCGPAGKSCYECYLIYFKELADDGSKACKEEKG